MKISKLRKKARSAFKHPRRIRHRADDGVLHVVQPEQGVTVPVVVIHGRQFTKPQAAVKGPHDQ